MFRHFMPRLRIEARHVPRGLSALHVDTGSNTECLSTGQI